MGHVFRNRHQYDLIIYLPIEAAFWVEEWIFYHLGIEDDDVVCGTCVTVPSHCSIMFTNEISSL